MGLLDGNLSQDQSMMLGLLGMGLVRGDFAGGAGQAMQYGAGAKERQLKEGLLAAQIGNYQSEADARKAKIAADEAARTEAMRVRGLIANAGRPQPGMGATNLVNDALPSDLRIGAQPQIGNPGIDYRSLYQQGVPLEMVKGLAETGNLGRPEVARTVSVPGANGEKMVMQLDKYGNPVGKPMTEYEAATFLNLGNRQVATIPRAGMSFQMGQTPDSVASNALGWANNRLARQRLEMDQNQPKGQYDSERGILVDPRTGTAMPVTQAGQAIGAKQKEMTDAQAKANLFGSRALEANRILGELEGKYWPGAVNAKMAAEKMPVIGAMAGYGANKVLTEKGQQAEQSQRDFINAILRRESGAVISDPEFSNGQKQYFPQPGDSEGVIRQKARNRKLAVEGIMAEVPTSYRGRLPSLTNPSGDPSGGGRAASGAVGNDNDPLGLRR